MWKNVGYYNGEIGPLEEMKVPMGDRALYFGDGIYEAACVANRVPFALEDHLDRMYNSLRLLEIPFRMERDRCGPSCRRSSKRRRRLPTTSCTGRCPGRSPQRARLPSGRGGPHFAGLCAAPQDEGPESALSAYLPRG